MLLLGDKKRALLLAQTRLEPSPKLAVLVIRGLEAKLNRFNFWEPEILLNKGLFGGGKVGSFWAEASVVTEEEVVVAECVDTMWV